MVSGQKTIVADQEIKKIKKGDKINFIRYFDLEKEDGSDFVSGELVLY